MTQRAKRYLRRRGFVVSLLTLGLLYVPVTVVGTQEAVVVNFSQEKDPVPDGWELSENDGKANLALVEKGLIKEAHVAFKEAVQLVKDFLDKIKDRMKGKGIQLDDLPDQDPLLGVAVEGHRAPQRGGFPQERHRRPGGSALCGSLLGIFQETGDCLYLGQHRSRGDH